MTEPQYQTDVTGLADDLRRAHGAAAFDFAVGEARQHIDRSAWKHCAMWLQVANKLGAAAEHQARVATAS